MKSKKLTQEKFVLLIVEAFGGKIMGKTLLQKRAYFVSTLLDLGFEFKPHYYGPYSPDIDEGLSQNKSLGFIQEQTHGLGAEDTVGFEVRRYDYSITSDGRQILIDIKKNHSSDWKEILKCSIMMKDAGDIGDYIMLSVAAKTFYILNKRNNTMTTDEISRKARSLGWDIKPSMIDKTASFLEKLSLVERN